MQDMAHLERTVPRGVFVIGSHGSPGMYQTVSGGLAPISNLTPMIQGSTHGRVMLLMCEVAHDSAAVQALSNTTGRSITAFTDIVGATNYSKVWAFSGNAATHLAQPSVFIPQYLSPFLHLAPNVAVPTATAMCRLSAPE
jgi:hypothetical protein